MTNLAFTHHAEARLNQRGVPPFIVELLDRFGAVRRSYGQEKVYFDKGSKKAMRKYFGGARGMRMIEPFLGVYAVFSEQGAVITVGHLQKSIGKE
ncbi:hypothetical protein AB9K41_31120 [Cribrihabitans sp. XS_ASV171]